jgi:fimbrial chaperone protein
MIMRRSFPVLLFLCGLAGATGAQAEGFAAIVSPPRFELAAQPGKTLRGVIEVGNRSAESAKYMIHTADWTLGRDFGVTFHDDLQPGSCRPWVAIERPEVEVPGGGTLRYRFEVAVPPDAPAGECRFAVMIEGARPSIAVNKALDLPITGRIGVIVYVTVGAGAAQMELLGSKIATFNGQQVPAILVHNSGLAHGRVGGYLTGTDAKGNTYDFTPSDYPILPQEEREVFLTPTSAANDHPALTYPVTVKGTLEWGKHHTELNERFE